MVFFLRLLRDGIGPLLSFFLLCVGCGSADQLPATDADGPTMVDLCPMLDPDSAEDLTNDCRRFQVSDLYTFDGSREFSGADGDVAMFDVADTDSDQFNPAGDRFVYQAWLTLDTDQLTALRQTDNPSWNVMQRGFADSPGGQWKLSMVLVDGEPAAQCVVRDGSGEVLRVHSRYRFRADVEAAVSCVFDDDLDHLTIVVDEEQGDVDQAPLGAFGDVAPHGDRSDCWEAVADQVAVGNKPVCGDSGLTADDRFQGRIRQARVLKQTAL